MRALALLLLAGCAGLPKPTPEALQDLRSRLGDPHGAYSRIEAEIDVESAQFAGVFTALIVVKNGPEPVVRLQLLPDVGGKVLDLVARRDRIRGWFPHTGEKVDVALPTEARAHPIVFFGLTLLERFAPFEGRFLGAELKDGVWAFELRPVSEAVRITGRVDRGFRDGHPIARRLELNFRGPSGASWVWKGVDQEEVEAIGFKLRVKGWNEAALDRLDEALFRLELPVDSR